jgi:imidazolonepropionase-like amidohydrolase
MLGLAERVGSIEPGKDADVLILTGPPLDYRTYVEKALVGGKIYYDRSKDKIYPDTPGR